MDSSLLAGIDGPMEHDGHGVHIVPFHKDSHAHVADTHLLNSVIYYRSSGCLLLKRSWRLWLQNDQRQISSAVQASIESAQAEHAQRSSAAAGRDGAAAVAQEPEEPQPAFSGPAHWAAAAGRSGAAQIRPEDFPALPGEWLCLLMVALKRPAGNHLKLVGFSGSLLGLSHLFHVIFLPFMGEVWIAEM